VGVLAALLVIAGGALALANGGGDEKPAAAKAPAPVPPLEIALKPAHRSGVSGTARLVQRTRTDMTVTVTLDKPAPGTHLAHIHTGPCSDEPTFKNPRVWANLIDVVDGRSETTQNIVTLAELRSEGASINVHDPEHNQRALVCGDIPRGS
jgi:hypothetical protein